LIDSNQLRSALIQREILWQAKKSYGQLKRHHKGTLHDLTGIGLFVVAVALLFLFDGFLGPCGAVFGFGQTVRGSQDGTSA